MRKTSKLFIVALLVVCSLLVTTGCSLSDLFGGKDPSKTVSRIELTKNIKSNYLVDDQIDLQGAKLRIVYNDESTNEIEITATMLSGFDTSTIGSKTLTITYAEKTATYPYTVKYLIEMGKFDLTKIEYYNSNNQLIDTTTQNTNGYIEFFGNNTCDIRLNPNDLSDTIHNISGTWQINKSDNTISFLTTNTNDPYVFNIINSNLITMKATESDNYSVWYFQYES